MKTRGCIMNATILFRKFVQGYRLLIVKDDAKVLIETWWEKCSIL